MNHRKSNQNIPGLPTPAYCPSQRTAPARATPPAAAASAQIGSLPNPGFGREYMKAYIRHSAAAATMAASQGHISTVSRDPITEAAASSSVTDKVTTATAEAVLVPHAKVTTKATKSKYKKRTKKYNNFNIFFMLERQLLLQSRGGGINAIEKPIDTSKLPMVKHKPLSLPPLCDRYSQLPLTNNWFLELLANQNKKRPHRKSHGLIPFKELAQTVAKHYREIDDETQCFVNEVSERLGWHCEELEVAEEKELLDPKLSVDPRVYASKKRKDAPVVSVAGRALVPVASPLSQDEAVIINHLMGLKPHSPPQGRPVVTKSDRLQFELAQAVNSRLESERRIHLLERQMAVHQAERTATAAQHPHAAARARIFPSSVGEYNPAAHEHYLAMVASASHQAGNPVPTARAFQPMPALYRARQGCPTVPVGTQHHGSPTSIPRTRIYNPNANVVSEGERVLIKEELLWRLRSHATSSAGTQVESPCISAKLLGALGFPHGSCGLPIGSSNDPVPLQKRTRYAEIYEDAIKKGFAQLGQK